MSTTHIICPHCQGKVEVYSNPAPTVDIIIECIDFAERPIILIERGREPFGWAIPGGFIDYGEKAEDAAVREALEETGMAVTNLRLLGVYSDPARDPRRHTLSVVYIGQASGQPQAGDDAASAAMFDVHELPGQLCFDHGLILEHYIAQRSSQKT